MRIGIFGGTFDPVHLGHLIMAERCREDARLDQVWFLPSFQPPHKADRPVSRFDHRAEMLALAVVGQPLFRVDPIEKDLPPPSFTAETLAVLQAMHPDDEFHLIAGGDIFPDLPKWYQPQRVLEQAGLVVVPRPGTPHWTREQLASALKLPPDAVRLRVVVSPLIDIASREIRQRVAAGQTVRYLVPRSVEEYIRDKKLYREAHG
jgi:nicotinate-nucleotide adenylyltransferase